MEVSVPIRGLFNLTRTKRYVISTLKKEWVSVPIRGLFNLTGSIDRAYYEQRSRSFRPHQGII